MTTFRPLLSIAAGTCVAAALVAGVTAWQARGTPPHADSAADFGATSGTRFHYPAAHLPSIGLPGGRRETIRSVLNIDSAMHYGDFAWNDANVPPGPVWVRVDLKHQLLSVFRGGHEIGTAVIVYGAESKPSPPGIFPVLQKARDYHSRTYDAPMPFMLRLTADGVAIHGSDVRFGAATHGCIGVPTDFARRLFAQVNLGDPVIILNPPA